MPETIRAALERSVERLRLCGIDEPVANAEFLLCSLLKCKRHDLYLEGGKRLGRAEAETLEAFIGRRCSREPVQYITGEAWFHGLAFKVTPAVLIPRPETETLVEEALEAARAGAGVRLVMDICTGSGCVAVAIASELKTCRLIATDSSPAALDIARRNALSNRVAGRVEFLCGDLFKALEGQGEDLRGRADIIVSNPPYVSDAEFDGLAPEIRDFEPAGALRAGPDGMDFFRRIIADAPQYMAPGARLLIETGSSQARDVAELMDADNRYCGVSIAKDLSGTERVAVASLGRPHADASRKGGRGRPWPSP